MMTLMPMNILIVEDSAPVRRMIRSLLADLAAQIGECEDGAGALAAYAQQRPDWVLMDIRMPLLDGLAATTQLKAAYPEARIIIVTNYDDPALREEACRAGACGFVPKEDLTELRSLLGAAPPSGLR
jgi:CheY-like chemotaxis protein